jgi:hypothetical protein
VKALVAMSCLCIIAVSAHYGYKAMQWSRAEEDRIIRAQDAARENAAAEAQKLSEERQGREDARAERRAARQAEREEEERQKQADRDNAASILKDAVVD